MGVGVWGCGWWGSIAVPTMTGQPKHLGWARHTCGMHSAPSSSVDICMKKRKDGRLCYATCGHMHPGAVRPRVKCHVWPQRRGGAARAAKGHAWPVHPRVA